MRWIRSRRALVMLVATVAVLTIALGNWQGWLAHAEPDLIVNDDTAETEDGCDSPDHSTIQAAINAASPGETIMVCEGNYNENLAIGSRLTIEGREGADRGDIEIRPAAGSPGIVIDHSEVTIRHLKLDGPGSDEGIIVRGATPGYKGIEISDVEVTDWFEGIRMAYAEDTVIEHSYIHDNANDGVATEDGVGNVVRGNQIAANGNEGLDVSSEDELLVEANTLSGNLEGQVEIGGRVNVRILRNEIDTAVDATGSDGIRIWNPPAEALIQIGGSPENANSFSGPFDAAPGDMTGDYYVQLSCFAENTVDATYNWWGVTDPTDIATRIFNDEDDPDRGFTECTVASGDDLRGAVVFHPWATEPAPTATPSPTPSPTPTATPSPTPSPTPTATPTPAAATRDFDLYPGWNDFVWTGATGTAPATVLSCIEDDYSIAYRFIESSQMFERQVPGETMLSNMTDVDKYDSLLVHVSASGVQCLGMPVEP